MIDTFFISFPFKHLVRHIRPACTPTEKLIFAIPSDSNRILPAIPRAFRMLIHASIAIPVSLEELEARQNELKLSIMQAELQKPKYTKEQRREDISPAI